MVPDEPAEMAENRSEKEPAEAKYIAEPPIVVVHERPHYLRGSATESELTENQRAPEGEPNLNLPFRSH